MDFQGPRKQEKSCLAKFDVTNSRKGFLRILHEKANTKEFGLMTELLADHPTASSFATILHQNLNGRLNTTMYK